MQFKQIQLGNGLSIIAEVNPAAASLATGFFVRTGSRDETPGVAGVSHFLEHMLFKGTDRRSPFDINLEFDRLGAMYNAFTSEENTVYFAAVLPEFQTPVLDLLGDMLRPALRGKDFDMEKKVILEEIALYQDRPQHRLFEKLMAQYFGEHPLSHSVLGTSESITALARQAMLEYFSQRYSPGNVTLVGAGRVDWDAFVAKAEQMCGHWKPYPVDRATPPATGTRLVNTIRDEKLLQQHAGMMSPAPGAQDDRRYAASLLSTILGDHTGSRLFYALIEPAIAEQASSVHEELDGTGAFITFVSAEPARMDEALRIVRREYDRFAVEGPAAEEVVAAKNKIASAATLKGELPMGRLTTVGFDWVYRRAYQPLAEDIERILAVTDREIHDLARHSRMTDWSVLGLGPKEFIQG